MALYQLPDELLRLILEALTASKRSILAASLTCWAAQATFREEVWAYLCNCTYPGLVAPSLPSKNLYRHAGIRYCPLLDSRPPLYVQAAIWLADECLVLLPAGGLALYYPPHTLSLLTNSPPGITSLFTFEGRIPMVIRAGEVYLLTRNRHLDNLSLSPSFLPPIPLLDVDAIYRTAYYYLVLTRPGQLYILTLYGQVLTCLPQRISRINKVLDTILLLGADQQLYQLIREDQHFRLRAQGSRRSWPSSPPPLLRLTGL
jgi:hypothetical protein